ncbi:MAG: VWA domain-containing protein [Verrucomicrobia bacterium]|nr:VWA domain-containing protein [Verrucomicrobiota bacterium]
MIAWGRPEWLWLLAVWAAAGWVAFALLRRRERRLADWADRALWAQLVPARDARRLRRKLILWLAAGALVAAALARPQWGTRWEEVRRRGLQIVVALDTSNSMLAADLKPSRLQQAKWGIRDLVARLKGDRVALLAFAGAHFLQCPMTIDYAAFLMTLEDLHAGVIPRGGTAIGQALRGAMDAFDYGAAGDRVVILVTDGEDHEGDAASLLGLLKEKGIKVFAVGVGTPEGELIPAGDTAGGFLKDRQGNVVKSALREDTLARLATATGGAYVRAAPGDFGLERIYEQGILPLRREAQESRMARMHEDRGAWFIGAALLLFALEALWPDKVRRAKRPNGEGAP